MNLSFKHYYWRWQKNQIFLFFFMLVIMTLARLSFALYFGAWNELLKERSALTDSFLLGLRYDLIPLAYINILPFIFLNLAYFIPGKSTIRIARFLIVTILCIGYFLLAWIYISDYGFYSYFQDHLNILFFGFFEDDTRALLMSIWKNYNLPFWLTFICFVHYVFYRFITFLFSPFEFDLKEGKSYLKVLAIFLSGLVGLTFFARGNFTRLPLSVEDAHLSSNEFINEIALNGVLTLNRAIKIRKTFGTKEYNYLNDYGFKSWQEAFSAAFLKAPFAPTLMESLIHQSDYNPEVEKSPPHVVMIVMESFGSYWNIKNSAEFNLLGELARHFKEDILFKNILSAENGTIGSMVSIATSQVIRPGDRFLSESAFMKVPLKSSVHMPYKQTGYETHFVYGGKLGWRDLGKYLSVQGYDFLWGADEIKESMQELNNIQKNDLGNEWGIFDEYLYAFIEEQLRTAHRPQFFLVLTTSNHPPFEYPSTYKPLPMKMGPDMLSKITIDEELAKKRFTSLQYSNQKVGEFISRLKAGSLQDKFVLALTGDHSYWITKGVGLDEEFKRFAVPFLISLPERLKPKDIDLNRFGSHEDIFPTLYHVSTSKQNYVKLGENLFKEESFAMNSSGLVANKNGAYHHDSFWKWKNREKQILEETPETPELSILKKHKEGLISITDLYLKQEKKNKKTASRSDQQ